ncbi:MAG TPA: hypothetical protein VIH00_06935 [Candidatus Limnocylindrales bacterium]
MSAGAGRRRPAGSVPARLLVIAVVGLAAVLAGCVAGDGAVATFPPGSIGPAETVSPAVALTRAELVRVLGTKNLVLDDAQVPFRPVEGPRFTTAPRAVFQVLLPDDPDEGFIVVYEFPDAGAAASAAAEQAAYLASGPGRIQSAEGTRNILRQVGSTVVFYSWVPAGATDAQAPSIGAALETLGVAIDIPS